MWESAKVGMGLCVNGAARCALWRLRIGDTADGAAAVSHTGQVSPPYSEPHRRDAAGQLKHVREDMQAPN
jgi:hypothetical protein